MRLHTKGPHARACPQDRPHRSSYCGSVAETGGTKEKGLRWVREMTLGKDPSRVRSSADPRGMSRLGHLVLSVSHVTGAGNRRRSMDPLHLRLHEAEGA